MSDEQVDRVMMNIRNASGSMTHLMLAGASLYMKLFSFLGRLAKKRMIAKGRVDKYKAFLDKADGAVTIYNVPLSAENAEKLEELNKLELALQKSLNKEPVGDLVSDDIEKSEEGFVKAKHIRRRINQIHDEIPELGQLERLGINYCVLPKLNGSALTMQVAIENKDQQAFVNWFNNHLLSNLSGGSHEFEELKAMTEGNCQILNLPLEGKDLEEVLPDFKTLGINYHILPDLKVGDGYTQIVVPNKDVGTLRSWFEMYRSKQAESGKDVPELLEIGMTDYVNTGEMDTEDIIANADRKYQEANAEFEERSKTVPYTEALHKENSEEFVKYYSDTNYEKISINKESLVDNMRVSTKADEMQKNGYFIARVPGTYGSKQQTLIIPRKQVFSTDNGQTYIAFLPKNAKTMVADAKGNVGEISFTDAFKNFADVNRGFKSVQNIKDVAIAPKTAAGNQEKLKKAVEATSRFNNFETHYYDDIKEMEKGILEAKMFKEAPKPKTPTIKL